MRTTAIRGVFVLVVAWLAWRVPGADLTASYVAGRLVAEGHAASLYTANFATVSWNQDPNWVQAVAGTDLDPATVTAYLYTPLWAWIVAPLASTLSFAAFKHLFTVLSLAAMAAMTGIGARTWAPRLETPQWQAGLLLGLGCSAPFIWSVSLGQIHPIFLWLAVLAGALSLRGREATAGALLAAAAAVKITPGWLALTWVFAGCRRATLSFVVTSAALAAATVAVLGWPVFAAYIAAVRHVGHRMTLSFNNDSLPTLLLGRYLNTATAFRWQPVALPVGIAIFCVAATALLAAGAGIADRRATMTSRRTGAIVTLLAATILAPLAWNHYFVLLVLPVMVLLAAWRERRGVVWLVIALGLVALNVPPLAYGVGAPLWVVALRSQCIAAIVAITALIALRFWPAPMPRT